MIDSVRKNDSWSFNNSTNFVSVMLLLSLIDWERFLFKRKKAVTVVFLAFSQV